MNRQKAKALTADLDSLLREVADRFQKEHGVVVKTGNGQFDDTTFNVKIEFAEVAEDGTVQTQEYNDLLTMLPALDYLTEDDLAKDFPMPDGSGTFKIIGWRSRAPKRPFLVQTNDGKRRIAPESFVRRAVAA